MNAIQLKNRAARLLARLKALGCTKAGKPLAIDQAYELVAAEEGYRNQHVLRQKLEDPAEAAKAEAQGRLQWHQACNLASWNRDSEIIHLEGFIAQRGLMAEFGAYALAAAQEEQSFGRVQPLDEVILEALQAVGFEVKRSEFYAPYWAFEDFASEDFDSEEAAWAAAWVHALERAAEKANVPAEVWGAFSIEKQIAWVTEHLAESPEDMVRRLADEAFENHDFGDLEVVGTSGWEWTTGQASTVRTVFLQDRSTPEAASQKWRFTVDVKNGVLLSRAD